MAPAIQCYGAVQATTRCAKRRVYGITYGLRDGLLGGWAQALWMRPGVYMLRLPDGLDAETFIGGGCGLVTAVHAVERAGLRLGHSVVVLGAGPVGQSAIALAAIGGADPIIAIGAPASRLAFARRMGATNVIDLDMPHEERTALVRELTGGRGADIVIEAAGAPEAVTQALDLARDGGRVVVCGQYTDAGDVTINPHAQVNRHLGARVLGIDFSHCAGRPHRRATGQVPGEDGWSQVRIGAGREALRAVEARGCEAVIVPNWR
jgi:L-iditol 2-dehydrogenase